MPEHFNCISRPPSPPPIQSAAQRQRPAIAPATVIQPAHSSSLFLSIEIRNRQRAIETVHCQRSRSDSLLLWQKGAYAADYDISRPIMSRSIRLTSLVKFPWIRIFFVVVRLVPWCHILCFFFIVVVLLSVHQCSRSRTISCAYISMRNTRHFWSEQNMEKNKGTVEYIHKCI